MNQPTRYYPALTGLRAVAAYIVFFHHNSPFRTEWWWLKTDSWLAKVMEEGYIGVSIFFVLSGFLIATRYQSSIELTGRWWKNYLRNRMARIYPMYALLTLLTFILSAGPLSSASNPAPINGQALTVLLLNLTFLRGFFDNYKFTGILQGWSLTVEECFYLLAPFLLVGSRGKAWRLVLYAVLLLGLGVVLVGIGQVVKEVPVLGPGGFMQTSRFMLSYTFFGRCVEFLVGIGLAIYMRRSAAEPRASGSATFAGMAWIGGCVWLLVVMKTSVLADSAFKGYAPIAVNNLLLPAGIVLLLYGLACETSVVRTVLESKLFQLLGKSSYVFYLIHMSFISHAITTHLIGHPPVMLLELITVSIILFLAVEQPLHQRLRHTPSKPAYVSSHGAEPQSI